MPPGIMPRPLCTRCHHKVTIVPETTGNYAVWCGCAVVSAADPHYRGVGRAPTEAEAIEAWRNWKPPQGKNT